MRSLSGTESRGERPAGRAQLLAKRWLIGQMQTPAELVLIPDASRMRPDASGCIGMHRMRRMRRDASGCVGMRRDFEFQQISANSGKIPTKFLHF